MLSVVVTTTPEVWVVTASWLFAGINYCEFGHWRRGEQYSKTVDADQLK